MEQVITTAINGLIAVAITAITGVCTYYIKAALIPWLKEKQLYSTIQQFVKAAEKLAETGAIEKSLKKDYVVQLLEAKGVTVDASVEALIESAVKELDLMLGEIVASFEEG